jgi:2-polyprenyl-3-methyl-5-hydroxy-6-metoxy-1,4-benzoquinol methylase
MEKLTQQQIWNIIAEPWRKFRHKAPEDIEEFLKTKKGKVLDLGCGRGWLSNLLSEFGPVVGIEPVHKVVNFASKSFPKIKFIAGDFLDKENELKGKKFSLIVCSEVIEHIELPLRSKFCLSINSVLDNNGFVIITTPRAEIQNEWKFKFGDPSQPLENWFNENEINDLFINNGFKVIKQNNIYLDYFSSDKPLYQTWLFQKI